MNPKHRFMKMFFIPLILVFIFQITACGTLLHPERRGQMPGQIDPSIAILDGIGLLFFVIPGLIAFAVDFSTGAIYLPSGKGNNKLMPSGSESMAVIKMNPKELNRQCIESIISEQAGYKISLDHKNLKVYELDGPESICPEFQKFVALGALRNAYE